MNVIYIIFDFVMEGVKYVFDRIKVFHSNAVVGRVEGNPKGIARIMETEFMNVDSKDSPSHHHYSSVSIFYAEDTQLKLFDFYNSLVTNIVSGDKIIEVMDRRFYEAEKEELYAIEIEIKVSNAS